MTIRPRADEPAPGEAAEEPYFSVDTLWLYYAENWVDASRLDLANPLDALLAKEEEQSKL